MDIFDKYALVSGRHGKVVQAGADPFGVCVNEVTSATRGRINGRDTILVGTNNYLGLTFDPACTDAAVAAIRKYGTLKGTWKTVWRIARCGPWTPAGTVDSP